MRILVAYLGEKHQANWWGSEFYAPHAAAFLEPVFHRSCSQAQYQGAVAAAAKVHDESIGVGRIFHLFRLPIAFEQNAAALFDDTQWLTSTLQHVQSRDQAMAQLAALAGDALAGVNHAGPMAVGNFDADMEVRLPQLAAIYHHAFTTGEKIFPFMREVM